MNRVQELLTKMHQIMHPGEYGLGTEFFTIPDDEKLAWETLSDLRDELESLLIANHVITTEEE